MTLALLLPTSGGMSADLVPDGRNRWEHVPSWFHGVTYDVALVGGRFLVREMVHVPVPSEDGSEEWESKARPIAVTGSLDRASRLIATALYRDWV